MVAYRLLQDVFGAQLSTSLKRDTIALLDVVEMAALRRIRIPVDRYPLSEARRRTTTLSTDAWWLAACS